MLNLIGPVLKLFSSIVGIFQRWQKARRDAQQQDLGAKLRERDELITHNERVGKANKARNVEHDDTKDDPYQRD